MYIFFINPETSSGCVISSPVGQESSSSASKTSDEKFRVTKTLFSIDSMLSSKETLSWLMRLLSVVGLMTMMRGTPWGDLGPVGGIFPKFRQSKESLLWLFSLSQILPFSPQASEIALVRLWLRLLVRTRRGRAAMVRELETSSWSQVLDGSLMTDGCWECQKVNTYMRKSPSDHGCVMFYYMRASSVNRRWIKDNIVSFQIHTFTLFLQCFLTFSAVWVLVVFRSNCFLQDLLQDWLRDDMLLKESPDLLPRGSISTSLNNCKQKIIIIKLRKFSRCQTLFKANISAISTCILLRLLILHIY